MEKNARKYYNQGYSCSESIIHAAIDKGLCENNLLSVATAFSGGMSSGCVCGAVAGAQMVLGANYGKNNNCDNKEIARTKAEEFVKNFKKKRKATCCKVLSAGYDFDSSERKENCATLVQECSEILTTLIEKN